MNLLNTLFVLTPGAYVAREGLNLLVRVEGETRLRVPVAGIGSVACFGNVVASHAALKLCLDEGITLSFHSMYGRFLGRLEGPARGGLALRKAQFQTAGEPESARDIARCMVVGKLTNARQVLLRRTREAKEEVARQSLATAAKSLARLGPSLQSAETLDQVRGYEGAAAATYFGVLSYCFRNPIFALTTRSRRPPKDPVNALLSFAYALLLADCNAGLLGVGLDPDLGFLHQDRPGRPSLALDLMEEFRPLVADRVVMAVLNREQIKPEDFRTAPTGAVSLSDRARRIFIKTWQKRKQETVEHPVLRQTVPWGVVPHLQARLLARHLRGDLAVYPPFTVR